MTYVDGFVIPIPKKNVPKYVKLAKLASRVWMDHGALQYVEAIGEDLKTSHGLPFPKALRLKPSETVVFAWITYESKAHRDRVNAKVMKDPRLLESIEKAKTMPFDMKRMQHGGFKAVVEAGT
jgi:uncharacterized protein YbaA (DUF1428 family)